MDSLVGIIRTENTLTARRVRRMHTVDFEDCGAVWDAFAAGTPWYEFADSSLLPAEHTALLADWNALSSAVLPDREAVQRLLAGTVLGQPTFLPPVTAPTLPAPVKPTAAHPRAYAGTKYKLPKPKSPDAQDWRPFLCDPRRLESAAAEARLPDPFRVSLYPLVKGQSDTEIADLLALYWTLGLDGSPERLAATAYLFSLQNPQNSRDWCRLIVTQPPEQWTNLLTLVIESGAYAAAPPPSFGAMLTEVLGGKDAPYRAYWLLHGLTTQVDPVYLLAGYRLTDACEKKSSFHHIRRSGYFPSKAVLLWGEHCREADSFYPGLLLFFWEQCGLRDGLGECLEQADCTRMTPNAAYRFLRLLENSWAEWNDTPDEEANAKWAAVRPVMGNVIALVQGVPAAYQDKCLQHLSNYLWQWETPAELQSHLPSAFTLTERLCRPPFAEKNDPTFVTVDFLGHLPAALRDRFLSAPDASFKHLEQACRRDNDASLIGWGTWALTRHQAEFTVRCFESDPARLFHAAKRLGTLPKPMRDAVIQTFAPLLYETPRVALSRLEEVVTAALASGFPPEARAQAEPHALQLQQLIRDNRKALRRFLAAHWGGRTDYRQTHPLTRRWLAAHPALDLEKWQTGVTLQAETEAHKTLTLAVEQDPLEALKLGTYVGSCLGLGGAFTYSAAAVVLDINKQVVYARDKRGNVVGRQLVAVSEADQVVCYEVYPLSAQQELGAAFAEFDRQLASALGLPIYSRTETEDYEVAHILSHDWWDDCAWDLTIETDE